MKIGCPKEIKQGENRVGLTPEAVKILKNNGHSVFIETKAGQGIDASDDNYKNAGATISPNAATVWGNSELIVKVKEPQRSEINYINSKHVLFTYLHLAADIDLAIALKNTGCTAIAYDTITDNGVLPLLFPMSVIAGKLATQIGANLLEKQNGGRGVLLGGYTGVERSKVTIIGAGASGKSAAEIAIGMGANTTILDIDLNKLSALEATYGSKVQTLISNSVNIDKCLRDSDLVISAVLRTGRSAPKIISNEAIQNMKNNSVFVDIAIDQGGVLDNSIATSHENPTYKRGNTTIYSVPNIPSSVSITSTYALVNATLPYIINIAGIGYREYGKRNAGFSKGIATENGKFINTDLMSEFGLQ